MKDHSHFLGAPEPLISSRPTTLFPTQACIFLQRNTIVVSDPSSVFEYCGAVASWFSMRAHNTGVVSSMPHVSHF